MDEIKRICLEGRAEKDLAQGFDKLPGNVWDIIHTFRQGLVVPVQFRIVCQKMVLNKSAGSEMENQSIHPHMPQTSFACLDPCLCKCGQQGRNPHKEMGKV